MGHGTNISEYSNGSQEYVTGSYVLSTKDTESIRYGPVFPVWHVYIAVWSVFVHVVQH